MSWVERGAWQVGLQNFQTARKPLHNVLEPGNQQQQQMKQNAEKYGAVHTRSNLNYTPIS